MKSPVQYIRQSLSAKLSIWIVLFALLIFSVSLGVLFVRSLNTVRQEALDRATQVLNNTVLRVNNILQKVETATDNTYWLVMRHLDEPDSMFIYSQHIIASNPFLNGCSISFEPYYFKEKGRYFSAYSYNNNGKIESQQEGNELYDYFYMDWYMSPKLLDRPCWTEPFIDYDPSDPSSKDVIASYCKPMKDSNGKYVGTISVDLPLDWLSETIQGVKPYPNSFCIMIGEGGNFYVHPGSEELFYETIFTKTLEKPDSALTAIGHAMLRGEEGMRPLNIEDENCYVFYKPLGTTGWSVALICTENDIFEGYHRLERTAIGFVAIGLLLMLIVFIRIVSREIQPLRCLANQTETIAKGHFDQTLADFKRVDEIGQLSHSFGEMQQSLVTYIDELKQTTATKAAIENDLRVASDIQMSMVPRVFPPFPERKDIDLHASMTPAKEVGGDLYNFLLLDERLYICLGDVSGKGVPASLFMAQSTRLFRTLAGEGFSPETIADRMNNALCEGNDTMMFVTMFIGMVDLQTGRLDYCNCGHNPPLLDGQFIELQYKNCPLGMFEGASFQGEYIADIRGKQLLIYTDGLNEAMNPEKVQFGNDHLLELMANAGNMTSCEVIDMLKEAVEQHRNGAAPNDDLTLLCLLLKEE
jgi:sigma-B regulation protein RsbU (phosphoserine phosphatase)